jgi:hypothetical protein
VLKKEDSRLAENKGGRDGGMEADARERRGGTSRFLKQQIIFPIYEDARKKAQQAQDERDKLAERDEGDGGWGGRRRRKEG